MNYVVKSSSGGAASSGRGIGARAGSTRPPTSRDKAWDRPAVLTGTGCAALLIGILVYLVDRAGSHAAFIPSVALLSGRNVFGTLGQWLPSLVHPFAFGLFTAAILKPGSAARVGACAFWGALNVAFEVGQHPAFKVRWADALRGGAGDWAITRSVLNYCLHGTFDPYDVGAAISGALAAAVLLHFVDHFEKAHHAPN